MNEIQLFSLRRTILLSLVLGLLSMVIVGQAVNTRDNGDGDMTAQSPNTSTSSTITSTTTTTSQTTQDPGTQTATVATSNPKVEAFDNTQIRDQQFDQDEAASLGSGILSGFVFIFIFSFKYIITSSLFFVSIAIFYILFFNNPELKNYINQSLKQAGFKGNISAFGKHWEIKGKGRNFNMSLTGLRNLRMKIELPKGGNVDPREFGLRRLNNSALTFCDLEVLPMRLQVVKMYLTKIE